MKTQSEERLLFKQEREKTIEEVLLYSKKRFKKFDEVIVQLFENKDLSRFFNTDKRIYKLNECFTIVSKSNTYQTKVDLKNVFLYLNSCSLLTKDEAEIQAVYNAFQFSNHWLNDLFQWKPSSKQAGYQFRELADYLFCRYKVPGFLYKAFYQSNTCYISWFIHLGIGGKVKEMKNIPIPFTQKMGHFFTSAPEALHIGEALRWAQVRGMNGDANAAERIAFSWIGTKPFDNENFWESFLKLLLSTTMFNWNKLTELIDYIRETKREHPDYNLKGRTVQSLVRQSDEWHSRYGHIKGNWFWKDCGIKGFKIARNEEVIKLEELTEAKKLIEEGTAMRHCVASYTHYCAEGKTAIYSLRKYSGGLLIDILATVEINIFLKRIMQAKARMNKPISNEAKKLIDQWAAKNVLTISPHL